MAGELIFMRRRRLHSGPPIPPPPAALKARKRRTPIAHTGTGIPFVPRRKPLRPVPRQVPGFVAHTRRRLPRPSQIATALPVPRKRRTDALPVLTLPGKGKSRRGRVPNLGQPNAVVPQGRGRANRRPKPVPPYAVPRPYRRRRPFLLNRDPTAFPVRRHRTAAGRKGAPPWAAYGKLGRRRRVPGSGLSALSFVVPRHRTSRRAPPAPPAAGRRRRGHLPSSGLSAGYWFTRYRFRRQAVALRPPLPIARRRRGRVPGTGLAGAAQVFRRRRARGQARLPFPLPGRARRRRVPGSALTAAPVVRRHRSAGPPHARLLPPWQGRRRKGKLIGTGLTGTPLVRHRPRRGRLIGRLPAPPAGKRRRGKLIGTGLSDGRVAWRHRTSRRAPQRPPEKGRARRRQLVQLIVPNAPPQVWDQPFLGAVLLSSTVAGGVLTLTWQAPDGRVFTTTQNQ